MAAAGAAAEDGMEPRALQYEQTLVSKTGSEGAGGNPARPTSRDGETGAGNPRSGRLLAGLAAEAGACQGENIGCSSQVFFLPSLMLPPPSQYRGLSPRTFPPSPARSHS